MARTSGCPCGSSKQGPELLRAFFDGSREPTLVVRQQIAVLWRDSSPEPR